MPQATKRNSIIATPKKPAENDRPGFKKPIGRSPSRQSRIPHNVGDLANFSRQDDGLGTLDGFRASSRKGFREPEDDPQYVEDNGQYALPKPRKSRLSLSDRTVESLAQIPSSPRGGGRRKSSFFTPENSMPPPARPASAMGNGKRPGTSDGNFGGDSHLPPATPARRGLGHAYRSSMTAPGKRSVSAALPFNAPTPSKANPSPKPTAQTTYQPLVPSQTTRATPKSKLILPGSKSMAARTPRSRPSLSGLFEQPSSPPSTFAPITPSLRGGDAGVEDSPEPAGRVSNSSAALREQIAKAKAARRSTVTKTTEPSRKPSSSSGALREQIAKAKEAARRNAATKQNHDEMLDFGAIDSTEEQVAIVSDPAEMAAFDFGLDEDPFNLRPKGNASLLRKRIDAARLDGRLNIAAMGLNEFPEDVLKMYDFDPSDSTIPWGEIVDLTALIAADNDFEVIPDELFPDVDVNASLDNDAHGPQFEGLQALDLHGNMLREIPSGLRRLQQITKLNLSRNKLTNGALEIISQMSSLKDLKLAENGLEGVLPGCIGSLSQLEILELQGNKLSSLPDELQELVHIRTLNITGNHFRTLPMTVLTAIPVIELLASKNALNGSLFRDSMDQAPYLQILDVSSNAITALCETNTMLMPALKTLNISNNRFASLPDISSWTELITLLAGENKLSKLPDGFTTLQNLRSADFTGNDLTKLDERIALMEGLEILTVAANPLRDRKFLTMNAEDIKKDLYSRLEPAVIEDTPEETAEAEDEELEALPAPDGWVLKTSGTLDLSSKNLSELDEAKLAAFIKTHEVRQLYLYQNSFDTMPALLSIVNHLTVLDLSKNNIVKAISEPLRLPHLRELRLANNKLQSLDPLMACLIAPCLQHLDVTNNRIFGSLPVLREVFPDLTLLMASDNVITDVPAESLRGLKVVNLSNNEIARLPPEIGLLAGTLTSFEVEGNTFRVPSYAILKKGTEAVLTWLRDKIPNPDQEAF